MCRLAPCKLQTLLRNYRAHQVMDAATFSLGGGWFIRRPPGLPPFTGKPNSNHAKRFA